MHTGEYILLVYTDEVHYSQFILADVHFWCEQVQQSKNRWKCTPKSGVMHIN